VSDASYVLPGDHLPDLRAQPTLLWEALGRTETTTFADWPEVYMPRESWSGTLGEAAYPAEVIFRHAQTPGKSLEHREPALDFELPLETRGFRFSLYRSPDESLAPLLVAPQLVARPGRRAEAVPEAVGKALLAGGMEERLVAIAPHIESLTIDDGKLSLQLRLWPREGEVLKRLVELAVDLRRRADEVITEAAGSEGTLTTHPEVVALQRNLQERERAGRRRTALAAGLLFGIPALIAIGMIVYGSR
jgi:hypothetical protein